MILIWMYPKIVKQSPLNHLHDGLAIDNDTFVEVRHIICCNLNQKAISKIVGLSFITSRHLFQLKLELHIGTMGRPSTLYPPKKKPTFCGI